MQVGTLLFTVVVITVHLELATVLEHWTWLHCFAIWFSVCARSAPLPPPHGQTTACLLRRSQAAALSQTAEAA